MTTRLLASHFVRLASAVACLAAMSGCGPLHARNDAGLAFSPPHGGYAPALRLTQLNYGGDASFAYCAVPACPEPTPKTIGVHATAVSFHPDASSVAAPAEKRSENVLLYFPPGVATLDRAGKTALAQFAEVARQSHKIIVSGRTDDTGSAGTNQRVAVERASNVERYIRRQLGPIDAQVETDAKGACCYVSSNSNEDGRKSNRRVEVTFLVDKD